MDDESQDKANTNRDAIIAMIIKVFNDEFNIKLNRKDIKIGFISFGYSQVTFQSNFIKIA